MFEDPKMSSEQVNPSASAMRMLTTLGLELKDLAMLADVPDELITEETLPRLLLQIKNNRTAKETEAGKQDTAKRAGTFRHDTGLPFSHHSNQRMDFPLRSVSPPLKESFKQDFSLQKPSKWDLPPEGISKWDKPSTSTYNTSLTSKAHADSSPHPNMSFYQSSTPKPSPSNYPNSTHYPSPTPYPRPTNYSGFSHYPSSYPYPRPTNYSSSTHYPSPNSSSTGHSGSTSNPHSITSPRPALNPGYTSHSSSCQSSPHFSATDVPSGSSPQSKTPVQVVQYPLDHCSRSKLPQQQATTVQTPVHPQIQPPGPLSDWAAQLNTIMAAGLVSASMACYYGGGLNFNQKAEPPNSTKSDSDSRPKKSHKGVVSVPPESVARDFYGKTPLSFPYKCSICFYKAENEASWYDHVSEAMHTDKMLDLLKRYPEWDCHIQSNQDRDGLTSEEDERPRRRKLDSSSSWSEPAAQWKKRRPRKWERVQRAAWADDCLVVAGFARDAVQKKDLKKLLGRNEEIEDLHVYDRFAILRMNSPEAAKRIVDDFLQNPVVNRNVVTFEPLPSGKNWNDELMALAAQFGPATDCLLQPNKVLIEMTKAKDATKLVEHHQTNALQLEGQTVNVSLSTEFFSLKYICRKDTGESPERKRRRESRETERSVTPDPTPQTGGEAVSTEEHAETNPQDDDVEPDLISNLEKCITLDELDESSPEEERPDDDPKEGECGQSRVLVFRNLSQCLFTDAEFLNIFSDYGKVKRYILLRSTQEALVEMCSSSAAAIAAREINNKKTVFKRTRLKPQVSKKYERLLPGWSGNTGKETPCSKPTETSSGATGQDENLEKEKTQEHSLPIHKKTNEEEHLSGNSSKNQEDVSSEKSSPVLSEDPVEAKAVTDQVLSVTDPQSMDETNKTIEEEMENNAPPPTAFVEDEVKGMMEVETESHEQQEVKVPEEANDTDKPQIQTRGRRRGAASRGKSKVSVVPVNTELSKPRVTRNTSKRLAQAQALTQPESEPTPKTHQDPVEDSLLDKRAKRRSSTKRTAGSKGAPGPRALSGPVVLEGAEMDLDHQQGDSGKQEEEETEVREHRTKGQMEPNSSSEESDIELDDLSSPVGTEFIHSVTGYFCDLCEVIYVTEEEARDKHCTSLSHWEMLKKHAGEKDGAVL